MDLKVLGLSGRKDRNLLKFNLLKISSVYGLELKMSWPGTVV